MGPRGRLVHSSKPDCLYFLLPSNDPGKAKLSILRARKGNPGLYDDFGVIWEGDGYDGEPLIDEQAIGGLGLLSVFTTKAAGSETGMRRVVILEFALGELEKAEARPGATAERL